MERACSAHKAERREQSVYSKYMIAVQMAYEDMVDLAEPDPVPSELHLGPFSAVY